MALPMNLDLKGGSSSAESKGEQKTATTGGNRGAVFNVATGQSTLSAETGSGGGGGDLLTYALVAGLAFAAWKLFKK